MAFKKNGGSGIMINGMPLNDYINNVNNSSKGNMTTVSSRSRIVINGRVIEDTVTSNGKQTVIRNGKVVTAGGYDMDEVRELEKEARVSKEKNGKPETKNIDMRNANPDETVAAEKEEIKPLNANAAYRSHLKKLPYIDDGRAASVIEFRANGGTFLSQNQVFEFLKLKPHEISALKNLLFINDEQVRNALKNAAAPKQPTPTPAPIPEAQPAPAVKKGRIVDF